MNKKTQQSPNTFHQNELCRKKDTTVRIMTVGHKSNSLN